MLLDGVRVVLVNTRFPENVGMAVRACANMGCSELTLVTPEMWIPEKAAPLATAKGAPLLSRVKVVSSLAEAVGDCHLILATTARTGGWRKALQSPGEAACDVARSLSGGERVAIVFGNESRGLENSQIELCQRIVTIPTSGEASSLNLAQSVLILLYECAGAVRRMQRTGSPEPAAVSRSAPASPEREEEKGEGGPAVITGEDEERLMEALKDALLRLDDPPRARNCAAQGGSQAPCPTYPRQNSWTCRPWNARADIRNASRCCPTRGTSSQHAPE